MPVYQCFAYTDPVFKPAMRLIAAITNAQFPTVTTTFAHGYVDETIVRFTIPPALGMIELDQMTSAIVVTGPTTFTINIDTTLFTPFAIPIASAPQVNICGLVTPIGELSDTLKASLVNVL